jgi:hypothetical protein
MNPECSAISMFFVARTPGIVNQKLKATGSALGIDRIAEASFRRMSLTVVVVPFVPISIWSFDMG